MNDQVGDETIDLIEEQLSMVPVLEAAFAAKVVRSVWQERADRKGEPEADLPEATFGGEVFSAPKIFCSIAGDGTPHFAETGEKHCHYHELLPPRRCMLIYEGSQDSGLRNAGFGDNFVFTLTEFIEENLPPALHRRGFDFIGHSRAAAGPKRAMQLAYAWRDIRNPYIGPERMSRFA